MKLEPLNLYPFGPSGLFGTEVERQIVVPESDLDRHLLRRIIQQGSLHWLNINSSIKWGGRFEVYYHLLRELRPGQFELLLKVGENGKAFGQALVLCAVVQGTHVTDNFAAFKDTPLEFDCFDVIWFADDEASDILNLDWSPHPKRSFAYLDFAEFPEQLPHLLAILPPK